MLYGEINLSAPYFVHEIDFSKNEVKRTHTDMQYPVIRLVNWLQSDIEPLQSFDI